MAEHADLSVRLGQRPGLLVMEADPLSGASAMVALALDEAEHTHVLAVDARQANDAMDLAMAIADAAIGLIAPDAAAWWHDPQRGFDPAALRLSRLLAEGDLEDLQRGWGTGTDRLRESLELVVALSEHAPTVLAVDHLDTLLERLSATEARELLGVLRAARQRPGAPDLLLVGRPEGPLVRALRDKDHPLWQAGSVVRLERPHPQRFADDFPRVFPNARDSDVTVVRIAAELAAGSPAYVWRTVDRVANGGSDPRAAVVAAWGGLRAEVDPQTARWFEALSSVQRAAPMVLATMAVGLRPYEAHLNDKTINTALVRLRARGVVFSPRPRNWAISDPLLAAWAREHASSALRRRVRLHRPAPDPPADP